MRVHRGIVENEFFYRGDAENAESFNSFHRAMKRFFLCLQRSW
jgi:hypothetical protein